MIGALRRRVTFLRRSPDYRDSLNEPVGVWSEVKTVWADHYPIKDTERVRAQEVSAEMTDRFTVAWRRSLASLGPADRLVYDGRTYDIVARKEVGFRERLEFTAATRAE